MSEISHFALVVLLASGTIVLALLGARVADRLPVPEAVVFLAAAALAATLSDDVANALSLQSVERIAVVALVFILLDGGLDIGWRRLRSTAGPVLSAGLAGTFVTAGLLTLAAHVLLGLSWTLAGVAGAALAPTDPAVVFSVLGGKEVEGRSGTVLEGEAGVNDPAGIALMLGVIEVAEHPGSSLLVILREFALAMGIGAIAGLVAARLLAPYARRLAPVPLIALAFVVYGATTLAHGSGFLAVFVLGLKLADIPRLKRATAPLAGLAEVVVFVALGLTIALGDLGSDVWWHALVLVAVLAIVARPVTVALTLAPFGFSRAELGFLSWSGLKGAVPILLAAFATLSGIAGAYGVYEVVFVVVLLSVAVQGGLVPRVARALGIPMRERTSGSEESG